MWGQFNARQVKNHQRETIYTVHTVRRRQLSSWVGPPWGCVWWRRQTDGHT